MSTRLFKVLLEYDMESEMWVSYVPSLNNISTFGSTRDEALKQTEEAILGYLETAAKENISIYPAEWVDMEVKIA